MSKRILSRLKEFEKGFNTEIKEAKQEGSLEALRIKYLGRKSFISKVLKHISKLPKKQRPAIGNMANRIKNSMTNALEEQKRLLERLKEDRLQQIKDFTLPGVKSEIGHIHPITRTIKELIGIFSNMGFGVVDSPEIETEYYNFQALNIPKEHPSRETFHTFYLEDGEFLLRSQTSTCQIRVMEKEKPPVQIIHAGKVYRPDAVDASHSFLFHQIEGLFVDEGINFGHLKWTLSRFCWEFFGPKTQMRFRPHYFPFTEPSAEVDISCYLCKGRGCRVCSFKGWLEILGCGMVHPNVFKFVKYDPEKYTGFAFGMGVERIAMLKYGIDDIRLFYENDVRFLRQF